MRNYFAKSFIGLCFLLITILVSSQPNGKYCGNVVGNDVNINFDSTKNLSNISANIYGEQSTCNNEKYTYHFQNSSIEMSNNPKDCLNLVLKKYNLCPCPPQIKYNAQTNSMYVNTDMGDIELDSCQSKRNI